MSFKVSLDQAEVDRWIDGLVSSCDEATRPAAQAGAQVFYAEATKNVQKVGRKTGNLAASIYQVYSKDQSNPKRSIYHVSWNAKKAPHGHLVEFGHWQRYVVRMRPDGTFYTAIRPEMIGKPKPPSRLKGQARIAAFDAYYLPLPGGPRYVAASPYIRPAFAKADEAAAAMRSRYFEFLEDRGYIKK